MKKFRKIFVCFFLLLLFTSAALTFLIPAKAFSPNENRVLAQMPEISGEEVTSGRFQQGLSDFLSDQVPFRDFWIGLNTGAKKLLGQKLINGVYLGSDHYYFPKFTDESYSATRMNTIFHMMGEFISQTKVPATVMLVPTAGSILKDQLPNNAPYYDEEAVYQAARQILPCPVLDLRSAFSASEGRQLYYRTDHHWTTYGAELAYQKYCNMLQTEPKHYHLEQVSDSFYGTVYSKVLDHSAQPDRIFAPQNLPPVTITFEDGTVTDSPYQPDFLKQKDKYAYFFGGNWGKITVHTGTANGRKLLILKDSFANSFVPFLFGDYEEITMLDLRYFKGDIQQVMAQQGITQLLFLYETTNLLTDTGILSLRKSIK